MYVYRYLRQSRSPCICLWLHSATARWWMWPFLLSMWSSLLTLSGWWWVSWKLSRLQQTR